MRRALAAAAAVAIVLAGCGSSPEDTARDDGKDVGKAVRAVFDSTSADGASQAVQQLRSAVQNVHADTKDRVQSQAQTMRDQLTGAVNTAKSAGSPQEAQASLKSSAQDVRAQADAFRNGNNSIANEFWRGFEEGYDGD